MSPAAKIPGTLVSRYSFTTTPRSVLKAGLLGERERGPHAHSEDEKIGFDAAATAEHDLPSIYAGNCFAQVEDRALRFVKAAKESADFRAHHTLKRLLLRGDHMNSKTSCAQRGGDFERNEARAYEDDLLWQKWLSERAFDCPQMSGDNEAETRRHQEWRTLQDRRQ